MHGRIRKVLLLTGFVMVFSAGFCLAQEDVKGHPSCKYCGMDRAVFAQSRMLVTYEDGTAVGTCSIHCTAVDLALNIDKAASTLEVGDYKTKGLINGEKAYWVIDDSIPGVMTGRAKWAFGSKADAETYIKGKGGKLVSFEDAVKASYEDMYSDTKMIRDKRKMKKMKMEQGQMKHE